MTLIPCPRPPEHWSTTKQSGWAAAHMALAHRDEDGTPPRGMVRRERLCEAHAADWLAGWRALVAMMVV